jgi:DNA-binding MarR family transcriptional regulator
MLDLGCHHRATMGGGRVSDEVLLIDKHAMRAARQRLGGEQAWVLLALCNELDPSPDHRHLATELGYSPRTLKRHLVSLHRAGAITWQQPTDTGPGHLIVRWRVAEIVDAAEFEEGEP